MLKRPTYDVPEQQYLINVKTRITFVKTNDNVPLEPSGDPS